ncbi:unnamed protein product, partial [Closterium sp. NIES-53]
ARYSSPPTAPLSRLMLPYLFPDLAAFTTVADLVAHLRTSDARYRASLPTEDHFLSLCPTKLTVDLLEERLAAAEKSILAVGASRGDRRTPFFEGRSELRLPLVGDAATARARGTGVVEGVAGAAAEAVEEAEQVTVEVGLVPGVGASVAVVEVVASVAEVVEAAAAVVEAEAVVVLVEVQPRSVEALVAASASRSYAPVRPRRFSSFVSSTRGVGGLGFAPSTVDPSLFLRTDTTLLPFYVLVYVGDLVFATADSEALAHVKAQRTITLTQSHMVQQVLQRFGFMYSLPQSTPLPTGHSLSAPPSDESVEPSGPYPELVGCLMYLMACTRPDLAYPFSLLDHYVAPGRHRKVHWDAAKRVLRYLNSTLGMGLVLGGRARVVLTGHAEASWVDDLATQRSSSCEAEIYAGAMAAQELRWLTYLLTYLGEAPRSHPVRYVDNKAMLALCQEHRLEHRTKHIALRYFLARELQQCGQLRLAYVASQANTADVFTKALQPCDHQRFCTVLGLVPTVPHLLSS